MARQVHLTPLDHHTGLFLDENTTVRDPVHPAGGDGQTLEYGIVHPVAPAVTQETHKIWDIASLLQVALVVARKCSEIEARRHQLSKARGSLLRSWTDGPSAHAPGAAYHLLTQAKVWKPGLVVVEFSLQHGY